MTAAAAKFRFEHMDASESAFTSRQLEVIRARTYDIKLPPLKARSFLPVDNSVSPGAETVTYGQYEQFGLARVLKSYAEDLPRADVKKVEFTSKIRGLGAAYGYSIQEIRAAMFAGVSLDQKKATATRRAIEEQIDTIARTGLSSHGLNGFINAANVSTYTVPNGAGGSALFKNKTPDEVVKDLNGIANGIVSSTKEIEIPDTLLLPIEQYTDIATRRMGDGSNVTILQYFLTASPYVKQVAPWSALKAAGAGATDRMICYRRDPDVLQLVIPQEFEQLAPQQQMLEIVTPCHARCGGVVVYYPLAISTGDGI